MADIKARLQAIEDRAAIANVLQDYYDAVDSLSDLDPLVACFTPDAVMDLTELGLAQLDGEDAIRGFFAGVFAEMTHHAHHVSNFRVTALDGDGATGRGTVIGRARGRSGLRVDVSCRYDIDFVRTPAGWKMARFAERSLLPLDGEVAALHDAG